MLRVDETVQRLNPGVEVLKLTCVVLIDRVKELGRADLRAQCIDLDVACNHVEWVEQSLRILAGDLFHLCCDDLPFRLVDDCNQLMDPTEENPRGCVL